jgi:hypothetical protein
MAEQVGLGGVQTDHGGDIVPTEQRHDGMLGPRGYRRGIDLIGTRRRTTRRCPTDRFRIEIEDSLGRPRVLGRVGDFGRLLQSMPAEQSPVKLGIVVPACKLVAVGVRSDCESSP